MLIVPAKQSDGVEESSFNGRIERCTIGVHPINAPHTRPFIIQAQRGPLIKLA